jgi:D-alanyl-D-alanine carboxypeptidase
MKKLRISIPLLVFFTTAFAIAGCTRGGSGTPAGNVPPAIAAIFDKPMYKSATWGLRVVDLKSGAALIDLRSNRDFFIGSVRKIFSVGELLNEIGPKRRYNTPVYRRGEIDRTGVLYGDLILVASGDLTMGGRTNADGTIAITDFDHNEADSLGNAELTRPNPLAGYAALAQRVAAFGIKKITGNVIIDDRLFKPFNFRGEFNLKPIFVNDDVVDLTINPAAAGHLASVVWRPRSAALGVENRLITSGPGSRDTLKLSPEFPQCIGEPGCTAAITGQLPMEFVPPLTNKLPLIQTFRIVQPSNYARTVFIEALQAAGVSVGAAPVARNPVQMLPPRNSYRPNAKIAELTGLPYGDYARLILKVSYNIGADTSLLLFGLTHGVDNMNEALAVERKNLTTHYGIANAQFHFVDGSGGGETTATNSAVTKLLIDMSARPAFPTFFAALPILSVDGSLGFVTDFQSNPTLAGAKGQVRAKTGTFVAGAKSGLLVKGQAFGGYIDAKSGRRLVYELVVNNVPVTSLNDVLQVFQDQGTISAILWRDN